MRQRYFDVPFALSGDQTAIPDPLQAGGTVSFTEGWNFNYQRDLTTDPAALPIDRSTMNWLFYQVTNALAALQLGTIPEWITAAQNGGVAATYGKGAEVLYSASGNPPFVKYVSLIDNNTDTPGATGNWQVVADAISSSAQASAGTDNTTIMTPLRVAGQTALRALLAGSATQVFNVGPATTLTQAPEMLQVQQNSANYVVAGGTANAITATLSPAPTALTDGLLVYVRLTATNTGPATLNVNGLGAVNIVGGGNAALQGTELFNGGFAEFIYKSTTNSFLLLGAAIGPLQVSNAAASQHALPLGQAVGRLLNVQVFTSSGTYTQTPGTKSQVVRAVGGGGSGGGTPVTGASQSAVGGPGASGTHCEVYFATAFASGVVITVGAGGAAVNGGSNPGGTTFVGSLLTVPGGAGGSTAGPSAPPLVTGGGATGAAPTINAGALVESSRGDSGGASVALTIGTLGLAGAPGGPGPFGGGGQVTAGNTPGNAGTGFGAGGSGTATGQSQASIAGGPGRSGVVIIYEYGTI